jgi:hypothetical protein
MRTEYAHSSIGNIFITLITALAKSIARHRPNTAMETR